ncbi:MAG: hypothetical protein FJ194_15185 [Gammaproteobacteria bacterium]|nr:hypothetical protein [Gammaproteobacteria bacterium]
MTYTVIFGREARERISAYAQSIASGAAVPGKYLQEQLGPGGIADGLKLLETLLQTKRPQIFAESAVAGDGRDWSDIELSILGDISIATPVAIYDDGQHHHPLIHESPFRGTLIFVCGALLRNDIGVSTPDFREVVTGRTIDPVAFTELYRRRLRPVFHYIQHSAKSRQRAAIVTIPGLGCGQFAGPFRGCLGSQLQQSLCTILTGEVAQLPNIRLVRFDAFDEGEDDAVNIGTLIFRSRPLRRSTHPLPQLCHPTTYEEDIEEFGQCDLYSLVAWDPVSWPGNDFYIGSRATDDGVKAAATSSMNVMTGIEGAYDPRRTQYLPPHPYRTWLDVVRYEEVTLRICDPFTV